MDKLILSYQNSCLYTSDINILKNEQLWLNDRIISFYFEYLQNEIFGEDILLIGSEVTQAIKMIQKPDEINTVIFDPIEAKSKNFLLFPINNNDDENVAGGSHWSLCVLSKPDNAFFHFDSAGSTNHFAFEALVSTVKKCFRMPNLEIKRVDCLQQNNTYDCGNHVVCNAKVVCKTIIKSKSVACVKKLQYGTIISKRSELIEIIKGLSENAIE